MNNVPVGTWYKKLKNDVKLIDDCIKYYDEKYEEYTKYVKMNSLLVYNCETIGAIAQDTFAYLQEIEAILEHYKIILNAVISKYYQKYNERYNRDLSQKDIINYINGEHEVNEIKKLINDISFMRNKWQSIMKGLEYNHYQLTNITKLKTAGMEDSKLEYNN